LEQPGGADAVLGEDKGFKLYAAANLVANDRGPYDAQLLYRDMAGELAGLGVNLNIGPSADICSEGGVNLSALCFGTTPSQVAAYATAFNSGHHDRGVLTALKHVPFTSGSQTSPIYEPANIALFREVARRGPSDAIVVRLKAAEPSSVPYWAFRFHAISKSNNKRIFRRPNSEATLIVDLDAGSRGAPVRQGEAIVRALQLGGDAILIRDGSKIQGDLTIVAYDAVRAAVESNRLDMARVEEAYQRVQRLKARLRAFQHRTLTVQSEAPRSELH
jgi:beta-N-acetylhexosaminidase